MVGDRPTVMVNIPGQACTYPVWIGQGWLASGRLYQVLAETVQQGQRWLIVTDTNVAPLYLSRFREQLESMGADVAVYTLPAGEGAKSWHHLQAGLAAAAAHRLTRQDGVMALGGGVVSDLAGLMAALHYRGCQFGVVSTTLLAQVDASVGGKVAINNDAGKNTMGTFYQPNWVVMDTDTLTTLPPRELKAGLAEIAKTALLERTATGDSQLLAMLERYAATAIGGKDSTPVLPELISRCVQVKQAVVAQDVTEAWGANGSPRMWLNLGHTFAHAYEKHLGYDGRLLHGEAVAIGLVDAANLAAQCGYLPAEGAEYVENLLHRLGLHTTLSQAVANHGLTAEGVLAAMTRDKKHTQKQQRFVLPVERPGCVAIKTDVPVSEVLSVLQKRLTEGTSDD